MDVVAYRKLISGPDPSADRDLEGLIFYTLDCAHSVWS